VDISPNFAGTMMSISNFVANAVGSLAPIVAGVVLTDDVGLHLKLMPFILKISSIFVIQVVTILLNDN
jgi:hypothetical protein